mmetsp:Transcript_31021/g.67771  ORF Transcript_31021/g.67771 Transcript_31021/m.67771 type:complete len:108 (-) Transcript_31021:690-1013(-)
MLTVTQKTFPALLRGAARIGAPSVRHFGDTIGFDKNTHKLIDDQNERARAVEAVYFKKEDARLMRELLEKEAAAEKMFHELAEKYHLKPTEARALKSTWKSKVVLSP